MWLTPTAQRGGSIAVARSMMHSGAYVMEDLHHVGGTPAVLKYLLQHGYLHGDCLTVTGRTVAENLRDVPDLTPGQVRVRARGTAGPRAAHRRGDLGERVVGGRTQSVVRPMERPIKASGHIQVLYGNLAPEGAVAKITGKEGLYFRGPARVFDNEQHMVLDPCVRNACAGPVRAGPVRAGPMRAGPMRAGSLRTTPPPAPYGCRARMTRGGCGGRPTHSSLASTAFKRVTWL